MKSNADLLQRLADELRDAQSPADFSSMEAELAFYSALRAVATCIEKVLRDAPEPISLVRERAA